MYIKKKLSTFEQNLVKFWLTLLQSRRLQSSVSHVSQNTHVNFRLATFHFLRFFVLSKTVVNVNIYSPMFLEEQKLVRLLNA